MMHYNPQINRRTFLKNTRSALAVGGGILAFPQLVASRVLGAPGRIGANDRITLAHIGVGGMGTFHLNEMVQRSKKGEVNIAAVCDADQNRLEEAGKTAGPQAELFRDYRQLLRRRDIDGVIIATPDHWHA